MVACSAQLHDFSIKEKKLSEAETPREAIAVGMGRRGRLGRSRAPATASRSKCKLEPY